MSGLLGFWIGRAKILKGSIDLLMINQFASLKYKEVNIPIHKLWD